MAAYLSLKCRNTGTIVRGKDLIALDEQISRAFGAEPDPVKWFKGWMDTIGFCLATGMSFDETLDEKYCDEDIVRWLSERYENDSYFGM